MPLGTALASGLQTFTTIRDEQRRSRLHDLQVEGATLRNYGMQRQNQFYDDTYDLRLNQQRSNTERAGWQAETDRLRMELQEQLNPLTVSLAEEKLTGQRLSNVGQSHQNRRLAADATVAERTVSSRINESVAKADKAGTDALEARRSHAQRVEEQIQGQLWNIVDANGGVPDEALHDPSFQAGALALLNTRFRDLLHDGQEVARIMRHESGGFMLMDNNGKPITQNRSSDPNDPVWVFGEGELYASLFGDNAGEASQNQANFEAMQAPHQQGFAQDMHRIERTRQADQAELEDLTGLLSEHGPALSDFQQVSGRLGEIEAETRRLQQRTAAQPNMDWQGQDPNAHRLDALGRERAALEQERSRLEQYLTEAGVDPQYMRNPDQLQGRIQTLGTALARNDAGGEAEQAAVERARGGLTDARAALRRGLDSEEYLTRLRGSGDSSLSLGAQQDARDHRMAPTETVDAFIDSVMQSAKDVVKQSGTRGGREFSDDARLAEVRNDLRRIFAVNPILMQQVHNDPEAHQRLLAAASDATTTQAHSGRSSAITLLSAMRGDDPAVTDAMQSALEDNELLRNHRLTPDDQLRLAEMVAERMREQTLRGGRLSKDAAIRLGTQDFLGSR